MTALPIDLRLSYGKTYRVGVDESYFADRNRQPGSRMAAVDPWYYLLKGRRGHVYPHSDQLLGVATNYRGQMPGKLVAIGCRIVQDGDDGVNASFPPELLPKVARIVGLYRRRHLTPEHADRLVLSGCEHRFKPRQNRLDDPKGIQTP